eukprot:2255084-Rhodomonas_salina.1
MALISLAHKFLSSKCEGDAGRNIHGRARIQPVARRALISSYNEEPSRGWDDFKVGAGFGATVRLPCTHEMMRGADRGGGGTRFWV